jgi:hypothetical protein
MQDKEVARSLVYALRRVVILRLGSVALVLLGVSMD